MQKQFTVNVPDELWVDSWDNELTATYNYDGPQYFYIAVDNNNSMSDIKEAEPFTEDEVAKYDYVLTIDAEVNPEIAYALHVHEHEAHEFEDVINHDGSIYKRITNPCLKDYFVVDFRSATENPSEKEAFLSPIYKDKTNILHTTAVARLETVKKYSNVYDFESADQAKIDTFIQTMTAYIELVSTAYPWKYITFNVSEVPKVPVALQLLFNQLPELS
jgi:protein-tyrosine-phosphatase